MATFGQIGALVDFTPSTTAVSSEVDSNFAAIRDEFNKLVTGTDAINVDTIAEVTSAAGVTIDGLLIKDSGIAAAGVTSGTLVVTRGGSGVSDPTLGNLLVGAGSSAMTQLAFGAAGGVVRSSGTAWVRSALDTGDVTTGTFADARIASSNITQHEASITNLGTLATNLTLASTVRLSLPNTGAEESYLQVEKTLTVVTADPATDAPDGWLQITGSGDVRYMPFWTVDGV